MRAEDRGASVTVQRLGQHMARREGVHSAAARALLASQQGSRGSSDWLRPSRAPGYSSSMSSASNAALAAASASGRVVQGQGRCSDQSLALVAGLQAQPGRPQHMPAAHAQAHTAPSRLSKHLQAASQPASAAKHAPASSASCCGTRWNWRPDSSQIQASSRSKPFSSSCTWCRLQGAGGGPAVCEQAAAEQQQSSSGGSGSGGHQAPAAPPRPPHAAPRTSWPRPGCPAGRSSPRA